MSDINTRVFKRVDPSSLQKQINLYMKLSAKADHDDICEKLLDSILYDTAQYINLTEGLLDEVSRIGSKHYT